MRQQQRTNGFILPVILVISITVLTVVTVLLSVAGAAYNGSYADRYQKLADEAAEAGSAYATACLQLSSHAQTWGPAKSNPDLAPNTDCNGSNSYSSNNYVYSDSTVRSYFDVGNMDFSSNSSSQVSAKGIVEALNSDGSIAKTYTSVQKKVITWAQALTGQMSSSGTNRTCAILNYSVYCWGYDGYGQLGDGNYVGPPSGLEDPTQYDSTTPVKVYKGTGVMAGKKIIKIFVARYHSCALSDDGLMYCWGYNGYGQLGTNNKTDSAVPVQVQGALAGKTITDIGGSSNMSCAIASGQIYCWGQNAWGQVGNNTTSNVLTPTAVTTGNTSTTLPTNYTATNLSTSGSKSYLMCAIVSGKAFCWGQNDIGSVGDGTTTQRLIPTKVDDSGVLAGKTVTSISQDGYYSNATGGFAHVCAVASGNVYCWGDNTTGQIGDGSTTNRTTPVAVSTSGVLNGKTIDDVQVGLRHSCVRTGGAVYCWGYNSFGQVGDNSTSTRTTPVMVYQQTTALNGSNVVSIAAGANRGCAVINDGRTFCWGLNNTGQIGDGTTTNRSIPTESLFLRPTGNQYIF